MRLCELIDTDIDFSICPNSSGGYQVVSCLGCPNCLPLNMCYDGNLCCLSTSFQVFHPDEYVSFLENRRRYYGKMF